MVLLSSRVCRKPAKISSPACLLKVEELLFSLAIHVYPITSLGVHLHPIIIIYVTWLPQPPWSASSKLKHILEKPLRVVVNAFKKSPLANKESFLLL